MFNDLLEITREFLKKLISSRLFILGGFLFFLFCVLGVRLFNLQIVNERSTRKPIWPGRSGP